MSEDSSYDIVVVGAGAAGLGAARRLMEGTCRVLVVEARDRLGGRAHSVVTALGHAVDVGCEWLHSADQNPWTGIARGLGFAIDETLPDWGQRVAWHSGGAAQEDWYAARAAFDERCAAAAAAPEDVAEATLLEPNGAWNTLIGAISTWANGTELENVSVQDHDRYDNNAVNWRVLRGYGTLVSTYGAAVPVRRNTVVERIEHGGRRVKLVTAQGDITARAVIVTVPTNVLAAEAIRFFPALPDKVEAAAGLPLGIANKAFLAVEGGGEALPRDRHLTGRIDRIATGNYQLRPHGWPLISCYFGGRNAVALEREGPDGMAAFAIDELVGLIGGEYRRRLTPLATSAWVADPFARGSYSCALPGRRPARAALATPVDGRLFFAGEACSDHFFGTAHGAFITGVAAADAALAALALAPAAQEG
jgi:monoamine oxidase